MKMDLVSLRGTSQDMLGRLRKELAVALPKKHKSYGVCIYACGSLGRLEFGEASDLDAFYIIDSPGKANDKAYIKKKEKIFFPEIRRIHETLKFPPPSKDGKYLKFTPREDVFAIGSQDEDYKNSYTARMLLLLESMPLYDQEAYDKLIEDVVEQYFIDYPDHMENFYPLYLMNDIKRYWYTLCLNYEFRRDKEDDKAKRYRKRLKLKFARRITCFSMLACLYKKEIDKDYVIDCVKKTPFDRFEMLAEGDAELTAALGEIKRGYEDYLELKTHDTAWWEEDPKRKESAFRSADEFQRLINRDFMQLIANKNQNLLHLIDQY